MAADAFPSYTNSVGHYAALSLGMGQRDVIADLGLRISPAHHNMRGERAKLSYGVTANSSVFSTLPAASRTSTRQAPSSCS